MTEPEWCFFLLACEKNCSTSFTLVQFSWRKNVKTLDEQHSTFLNNSGIPTATKWHRHAKTHLKWSIKKWVSAQIAECHPSKASFWTPFAWALCFIPKTRPIGLGIVRYGSLLHRGRYGRQINAHFAKHVGWISACTNYVHNKDAACFAQLIITRWTCK